MSIRLVCDLETDGLLADVTKIHCIVTKDADTGVMKQYHDSYEFDSDGSIEEGIRQLEKADVIVFHNYIGFDRKVIKKLYPSFKEPKWDDTFILSQILYSNLVKSHSIAEWGRIFQQPKPGHEDWSKLSEDMLHRCREDTHIGYKLFLRCEKSRSRYDIEEALKLEYKVYEIDSEYEHWYINEKRLNHFIHRLTVLRELLRKRVVKSAPYQVQQGSTFSTIFKKDGNLKALVEKYCDKHNIRLEDVSGPFSKVDFLELNPGSSVQVSAWLLSIGWKPDEFNYKKGKDGKPLKDANNMPIVSTPKFGGEFYGIEGSLRDLLVKFNKVSKRLGTLEGYAKSQTNGKMPCSAFTCGTNTARYRHRGIVNVPKASKDIYLGRMMRSLFVAPKGYTLVGCDASQLESRIEGHYTTQYDDGAYADFLLNDDIHSRTAKELGLSRDEGKTLNYALQYGASYKKVSSMLNVSDSEAKGLVALYWEMRPAATALKEDVSSSVESRGYSRRDSLWNTRAYIKTIDNRPIFVRSWHSLTNSLIQSTGSICMKVALCYADQAIKKEKLKARLAIMYHDEINYISHPNDAQRVAEILEESIRKGGEYFNLTVPLESEAAIGPNWGAIH